VVHGAVVVLKLLLSKFGFLFRGPTFVDENEAIFRVLKTQTASEVAQVMIDVGAHHGVCSIPFLKVGWRVVPFEPSLANYKICEKRLRKYNVEIDPRALGERLEIGVAFFESPVSSGISGLTKFDPSHTSKYSVDVTNLQTALKEHGLDKVGYLKIDTEGNDLNVLKGIDFDHINGPMVILAEFEDTKTKKYGYVTTDLISFLKKNDYFVAASLWEPIIKYGDLHRWDRIAFDLDPEDSRNAWGNIIAAKSEKLLREICDEVAWQSKKEKN
jgi:FkbM family methyltransferase